jgi:D-arabinose 1-dehydrogenase-like Zn-dependent alcohol dehydrogenase
VKAAVLYDYDHPLEVQDVEEPHPSDGEVLVRVRATGLCGTDLKLSSGAFRGSSPLPIIPGHEVAGELMEDVDGLPAGQPVACYLYETCEHCRWCESGRVTLCPHRVRIGLERNGGLAEYVAVKVTNLLPFSGRLQAELAAVAMDAVSSPWAALHGRAKIQAGERLLVVGSGGLGANGVQIAVLAGAAVAVVDPVESHRQLALDRGAELAVSPPETDEIRAWSSDGVDIALETSGARGGFDVAAAAVRPGGRVVCCGYYPGVEYGLDSARLVLKEIDIMGSVAASRPQAAAALAAVDRGEIKPPIMEIVPLERVNDALDRLRSGGVVGRMVIQP